MPEILAVENIIATDTVILRRSLLDKVGYFNQKLRNSEDFELWWRIGLTDASFAFQDKVYMTRHKLPGNLSSSSLRACENTLAGLNSCLQETVIKARHDLIPSLHIAYRNTWQNMIPLYAESG